MLLQLVYFDPEGLADTSFCFDCEAINYDSDTGPTYSDCPAGFDCSDKNCIRCEDYQEIIKIVEEANRRVNEICEPREYHSLI